MSVLLPDTDELFTLRIYKSVDVAADQVWANTYELQAAEPADFDDLDDAVDRLVAFEKAMHHDTVAFRRAVLSTAVADGAPYDPFSFVSKTLTGTGDIASPAAASVLPLQVCLFIRRDVSTGRAGKLMFRQALGEGDVQGRFGQIQLTSPSAVNTVLSGAITSSTIDDLFGPVPVANVRLVMAPGTTPGPLVRRVAGMTAVNARIIKYNNRYFDVP